MDTPWEAGATFIWVPLLIVALARLRHNASVLAPAALIALAIGVALLPVLIENYTWSSGLTVVFLLAIALAPGVWIYFRSTRIDIALVTGAMRVIWGGILLLLCVWLGDVPAKESQSPNQLGLKPGSVDGIAILMASMCAILTIFSSLMSLLDTFQKQGLIQEFLPQKLRDGLALLIASFVASAALSLVYLIDHSAITLALFYVSAAVLAFSVTSRRRRDRTPLYAAGEMCLLTFATVLVAHMTYQVLPLAVGGVALGLMVAEYVRIRRYFNLLDPTELPGIRLNRIPWLLRRRMQRLRRTMRLLSLFARRSPGLAVPRRVPGTAKPPQVSDDGGSVDAVESEDDRTSGAVSSSEQKQVENVSATTSEPEPEDDKTSETDVETDVAESSASTSSTQRELSSEDFTSAADVAKRIAAARRILVLPGHGALSLEAGQELVALINSLASCDVRIIAHPIAGRYPHQAREVLMAAGCDSTHMVDLEADDIARLVGYDFDLVLLLGANDIVNPALIGRVKVSLSPWLKRPETVVVCSRRFGKGFSGRTNRLFRHSEVTRVSGDISELLGQFRNGSLS